METITKQSPISPSKDDQTPLINFEKLQNNPSSPHSLFSGDESDISPIMKIEDFIKEFTYESKKLWHLAGPAIFTSICQYSLGAITQTFAGHVSTLDLAAFSVENSVIAGFSYGILAGMGSALETLCGQAYGAGKIDMLGIYMQRSWVILLATSLVLMFFYIFATPLLMIIGQTKSISDSAGNLAIWMIPQLFAYAINFPVAKFLQSQSKMMVMTYISIGALAFHTFFSWLFMLKLGWGLGGGAVVLNLSWWLIVVAQLVYVFRGACGNAWCGFSWRAFQNLWGFVRLSLISAVMLCLEIWYFTALIMVAGYLKNAEIAVASFSVCINIVGWVVMIALGFNIAISVRVSNELGAAHPRRAKFSVVVVLISTILVGLFMAAIILIFQKQYPAIFTNNLEVQKTVYNLTGLLVLCIVVNNIQAAVSGVAIGAGWQGIVAYVNITCYYIFGVPLGLLLGFKFYMGVTGIWVGMVTGTMVQTLVLFFIAYRTNWNKEASIAEKRIKQWGGEPDEQVNGEGIELYIHENRVVDKAEYLA